VIPAPDGTKGLNPSTAQEIVRKIKAYRKGNIRIDFRDDDPDLNYTGPFKTWPEFEAFIDQWVVDTDNGSKNGAIPNPVSNDIGYLLKAHFNPNTRFGKFNWNTSGQWTWISDGADRSSSQGNRVTIDKTDFLYYTTEFTFSQPTHHRVSSYGRIIGSDGTIKAEATVKSILRSHRVVRHTTQADFEVNEVGSTSFNTTTYPEAVNVVGAGTIHRRKRNDKDFSSGSGLGGQLSLKPAKRFAQTDWGFSPGQNYVEWHFDERDDSTRGKYDGADGDGPDPEKKEFTVSSQNDPHWPFAWMTREFNDVSDDGTAFNAGLAGGRWNPNETGAYPWDESASDSGDLQPSEDPYNYSDITPGGALMTSDRFRSMRFLTTDDHDGGPDVVPDAGGIDENWNWERGHIEFWWKPRARTVGVNAGSNQRVVYPLTRYALMKRHIRNMKFAYWGPHEQKIKSGDTVEYPSASLHKQTQQENFAWRKDPPPGGGPPGGGGSPGAGTGYDPVTATKTPKNFSWWTNGATPNPPAVKRVAQRPVQEHQPWTSEICDQHTYDSASDRWVNGQGTIASLDPENGCLTAYPGIQSSFTPEDNDDSPYFWGYDRTLRASRVKPYGRIGKINNDNKYILRHIDDGNDGNPNFNNGTNNEPIGDDGNATLASTDAHKFFGFDDYYNNLSGSLGSEGYSWRAYYVKNPDRPNKWVFKVTREYATNADLANGNEKSPTMTTTPRSDAGGGDILSTPWHATTPMTWTPYDNNDGDAHPRKRSGGSLHSGGAYIRAQQDAIAVLEPENSSDPARAIPKPGKWNHVVLEWNTKSIYEVRKASDDEMGGGVSYPIYVPFDFHYPVNSRSNRVDQDTGVPIQNSNSTAITNDSIQSWLPMAVVPKDLSSHEHMWGTCGGYESYTCDAREFSRVPARPNDQNNGANQEFTIPYISVNGVNKTRTDLHVGNINPMTGRFQPAGKHYAEHVVWDNSYNNDGTTGIGNGAEQNDLEDGMPHEELVTTFQYFRHWTRKHYGNLGQFGSNLTRKTKHYGTFTDSGPQTASFNWARFYDDGFIEGTVDEFHFTRVITGAEDGEGEVQSYAEEFGRGNNRYVNPGNRLVQYTGMFRRSGNTSYWGVDRDKFNYYAKADQRVLVGDEKERINIMKVMHTQYLPRDAYWGRDYKLDGTRDRNGETINGKKVARADLSEQNRPYFSFQFNDGSGWESVDPGYSDSMTPDPAPTGNRWLGEPVTPDDLLSTRLTVGRTDEGLRYRVKVENTNSPTNITPFLEDVTIHYANRSESAIKVLWYDAPER